MYTDVDNYMESDLFESEKRVKARSRIIHQSNTVAGRNARKNEDILQLRISSEQDRLEILIKHVDGILENHS